MQMQRTKWHYLAAMAVVASCGLSVFVGAGPDKKDVPKPLRPEIVKAWRDAGAKVGWMKMYSNGFVNLSFQEKDEGGAFPAFALFKWKEGVLAKLPDPGAAFGLYLA